MEKQPNSGKKRTLLVPSVRDRILQTAIARVLSRSFEDEFLECSFAYRPGRGVDRAIARIRELHYQGYQFVVEADLHAYFDEVDHDLLLSRLQANPIDNGILTLIRQWIRGERWDGHNVHPITKGLPQGSPISPLLANFFLEDFDRKLEASGQRLIRFADDFVVLSKDNSGATGAMVQVKALLEESHLQLNVEKTGIVNFTEGFRFLGAFFQGDNIWTPWKTDRKPKRIVFMAHPMPAAMRRHYEQTVWKTAMESAFERSSGNSSRLEPPAEETTSRSAQVAFLYLTQQGSVLRKTGDRFLVEKDDQILVDLPYHKLDHVLVFGNIQITTQAMGELLEKGVPVSLFSRQGTYRGALTPPRGRNVVLRVKQFDAYRDAARALEIARVIVLQKVENGAAVLEQLGRTMEAPNLDLTARATALRERLEGVQAAKTIAELDGHEGISARDYFAALMALNKSEFVWPGRKQHPSEDPLNALLSLCYTLIMHETAALLEGLGLDPYIGFLHQIDYGRPSLALDVMEPFRHPVADRFVLRIVNKRVLQADDFEKRDGRSGIFLKPAGMIRFFEAYEKWLLLKTGDRPCFRNLLKSSCERMAGCLREGNAYKPFSLKEAHEDWNTSSLTI